MIYLAIAGDTGEVLAAYNRLDLIHESHEFSNHKRTDIDRWEHTDDSSTVFYKDGSSFRVNIQAVHLHNEVDISDDRAVRHHQSREHSTRRRRQH